MRIKIFAYSFPHWMTRKNFPQPGFWLHLFQVFFFFSPSTFLVLEPWNTFISSYKLWPCTLVSQVQVS